MLEAKTIRMILITIIIIATVTLITLNHTTNIFSDDKNTSNNTPPLITLPPSQLMTNSTSQMTSQMTTIPPFINPISNFVLKSNSNELVNYLKFSTNNNVLDENNNVLDENNNILDENILNSNLLWNGDMNNIINLNETDTNRLAIQFRYFTEFWLNKLNVKSGFTDVLDSNGIIGKYEFSKNKDIYTAKFNNNEWNWKATQNYCFNTVNSKRKNNCMGGWTYVDGKCFSPASSSSICNNYDWQTMYNYTKSSELNSWMNSCNVVNSLNCLNSY